jgi:tetratricopeptide (TPR) repeat protein
VGTNFAPAVAKPYVDREPELAALAGHIDPAGVSRVAAHGPTAVGTTSLVRMFAQKYGDRFEATLYLTATDPLLDRPATAAELAAQALRQLRAVEVPAEPGQCLAAYRYQVAGRRLLVIVDGVTLPNVVEALDLSAPGSMLVVTARRALRMPRLGFAPIAVEPLTTEHSQILLAQMLDEQFDTLDPALVAKLLEVCAGLPLTLRIAASGMREQPGYGERLLAEVGTRGLAAFEEDGVPRLAAEMAAMYEGFTQEQATAYRWLALHPGADFGLPVAAAMLERTEGDTARLLRTLVDLHVLHRTGERYAFYPLVWHEANLSAERYESVGARRAVRRRAVEWYRVSGIAWEQGVMNRWRVSPSYREIAPATRDRRLMLAWLDAERDNLEAAVRAAVAIEYDAAAVDLCTVLWTPYHLHGRLTAAADTYRLGIDAARRIGYQAGEMQLRLQRAAVHSGLNELAEADRDVAAALAITDDPGAGLTDRERSLGRQSGLDWRGDVHYRRGDHRSAIASFEESWRAVPSDDPEQAARGRALLRYRTARSLNPLELYAAAAEQSGPAVEYFALTGETDNEAKAREQLGAALAGLGRTADALPELERALRMFHDNGSARSEARTRERLAALAPPERAAEHRRVAEELYHMVGDGDAARRVRLSAGG